MPLPDMVGICWALKWRAIFSQLSPSACMLAITSTRLGPSFLCGVVRLRHDLWGRCGGWFRLIHLGRDARRFNTLRQERGIAPLAAHHADERLEGIGNPFFYLVLDCHHIGNTFLVFRQRIQSLFDKREMFIGDFGVIIGLPAVGSRSTALGVLYSPCNLAVASPAASAFRVSDFAKNHP